MPILLDLFSGCGGLTLGSHNAGYRTALAIDIDPVLSSTFSKNFPDTPFLLADLALLSKAELSTRIPFEVDGVVGGPPCQAFSTMGRRLLDDPRRSLIGHFFRIVAEANPAFFMMENVPGLTLPANMPLLEAGLACLSSDWVVLPPTLLDASNYGAPTKRRRIFVFGFNKKKMNVPSLDQVIKTEAVRVCVRDAIVDLADSIPVEMQPGVWQYVSGPGSAYARAMRTTDNLFTSNQRTAHKAETILRFSTVRPGEIDQVGKHKRLEWTGLCPTLRAGTGNDRGSYQSVRPLHPDEDRVITPREASRLQGFPDRFIFHPTVWHSFRMIGNSVSPIIAEALLRNIKPYLASKDYPPAHRTTQEQA